MRLQLQNGWIKAQAHSGHTLSLNLLISAQFKFSRPDMKRDQHVSAWAWRHALGLPHNNMQT